MYNSFAPMSFARMLMGVIVDVVGERDERSRANNAVASACVDCGAGVVIPRDRHSAGDARLQGYGGFKSSRHHLSST